MFRKLRNPAAGNLAIEIDGVRALIEEGESVAAVLLRQDEIWSRLTPVSREKRAPYCMMGVCFECLAEVDGVSSVQTCLQPVREGMCVRRQVRRATVVR